MKSFLLSTAIFLVIAGLGSWAYHVVTMRLEARNPASSMTRDSSMFPIPGFQQPPGAGGFVFS